LQRTLLGFELAAQEYPCIAATRFPKGPLAKAKRIRHLGLGFQTAEPGDLADLEQEGPLPECL
jgi:hypothetical protein